ncbi:SMP-30/gluconolactonase/LRE family protein [Candidatus Marinimicrobia bacterium]|nr:SMP-30/gluconolactonase/LRE family protein [Candidatus Neomarinimicrobiota bacterium]
MKNLTFYSLLICLLYLLLWPVPIKPVSWESPTPPLMTGVYEKNDYLKNIEISWENDGHYGPEDIVIHENNIYVGYHDGLIMRSDGEFYNTNGRPLGMVFDAENNLIVADAIQGLISINQDGIATVLSTKSDSDGITIGHADDLDISTDGKIYFSDASNKFGYGEDRFEMMEHTPNGRLLVYDPETKLTTTLLDNLYFANGVALGPDDAFVLFNETSMYRIQKYWLKGAKAGTSEIIMENLPGFPDNISSNEKGIYWVALFTVRNNFIDQTANKPFFRSLALRLPEFLQPKPKPYAFALGIDADGNVLYNLQYDAGDAFSPITSVKQYNDHLYFGSLNHEGWGKIKVPK